MASGDKAAAQGFTPVLATDDFRLGYVRINDAADFSAYTDGPAPTFTGTVVQWAADWAPVLRKEGGMVLFSVGVKNSSGGISSGNTLLTLPATYRPKTNVAFVAPVYENGAWAGKNAQMQIGTDGVLTCQYINPSISTNAFIAVTTAFVSA